MRKTSRYALHREVTSVGRDPTVWTRSVDDCSTQRHSLDCDLHSTDSVPYGVVAATLRKRVVTP
jgi:hypothetical protein